MTKFMANPVQISYWLTFELTSFIVPCLKVLQSVLRYFDGAGNKLVLASP